MSEESDDFGGLSDAQKSLEKRGQVLSRVNAIIGNFESLDKLLDKSPQLQASNRRILREFVELWERRKMPRGSG